MQSEYNRERIYPKDKLLSTKKKKKKKKQKKEEKTNCGTITKERGIFKRLDHSLKYN